MALMRRTRLGLLSLFLALGLTACQTGQSIKPKPVNELKFAQWEDTVVPYRLGAGDKFAARFFLLPEMDEDVSIGPDGIVMLKAAGAIDATGLTVPEMARMIEDQSRRWVREPRVAVSLVETPNNRIYVGGSVARPGPYLMHGRTGTMEAILLAGGFDREARYEEVVLIRRNTSNEPMLRTVNLREFVQTGIAEGDVPLAPGDILFVPRSAISELNLWIDQFIEDVIPFQRSFSYTIGVNRNSTGFRQ